MPMTGISVPMNHSQPTRRYGAAVRKRIATIVIVLFAAISFRQVGYWKNSETLFRHTLRVTPPNALARSFISAAASNCVNTID